MNSPVERFFAVGVLLLGCYHFLFGSVPFAMSFMNEPGALVAEGIVAQPVTRLLFHALSALEPLFGLFLVIRFRTVTLWLFRNVPPDVRNVSRSDNPHLLVPPLCGFSGLWLFGTACTWVTAGCWPFVLMLDIGFDDSLYAFWTSFVHNVPGSLHREQIAAAFTLTGALCLLFLNEPISRRVIARLEKQLSESECELTRCFTEVTDDR